MIVTPAIEKEIATTCIVLQEFGFPLSKDLVGVIIRGLLNDNGQENPFTDGTSLLLSLFLPSPSPSTP